MNRPGDRLLRLAQRICSERTRRRLIHPAVADLQAETALARRTGSAWWTLRALACGYGAVLKVFVIGIFGELRTSVASWEREDVSRMRRGAWVAVAVIAAATLLMELPLLIQMSGRSGLGEHLLRVLYLAPSTLALTVPLGLAVAAAWVLHGAGHSRKVSCGMLVTAGVISTLMFVNLAWLTPDANQAFRVRVMSEQAPWSPPPARGDGELRFGDLRARLDAARHSDRQPDTRHLEILYYGKLAVSLTPLALVGLVVALAMRRPWTRAGLVATACAAFVVNYAILYAAFPLAEQEIARPIVLEWAGNALLAGVAMAALTWRRTQAQRQA